MSHPPKTTTGALLRARRQELGLTLDEVADRTRIRRTYLEALEEDRTDLLPGETYRTGFLRIYANLLGMKPEQLPEGASLRPASPPSEAGEKSVGRSPREKPPVRSGRMATTAANRRSRRSSGRGIFAVAIAALLVIGAVLTASLFRGPDPVPLPPAPVEAPSPPPPAPPPPAPNDTAAGLPVEGAPVDGADPGGTTGAPLPPPPPESQTPSPEGVVEPVPAAGKTPAPVAEPEGGAPAETLPAVVEPAPPTKNGVLRLEALGTNHIELILDNRAPQSYDLKADTQLSWKVRRSALIRVADPSTVKLWFGDRPLDLGGKTQILVQAESGQGQKER